MADKVKGVEIDPVREKLIELMFEGQVLADAYCDKQEECDKCPHNAPNGCRWGATADHLIANGVTVQECARPLEEWGEDYGDVLWWKFPIEEPPYVGSPLDENWPAYHTHWTPIICPSPPKGE